MAEFDRDLRYSLHKTSLLCLLVQAMEINRHCNDTLLQARLFSLVPQELHVSPAGSLFKILKWFVARKDHLLAAVTDSEESSPNHENVSDPNKVSQSQRIISVEMLVALLRALSLRARLVLAFNPTPFKPSKERKSVPCCDPELKNPKSEAGKRLSSTLKEPAIVPHSSMELSTPSPSPNFFKFMEQLKQSSGSNNDTSNDGGERGTCDGDHTVSTEHSLRGGSKRKASCKNTNAVKKRRISSGNSYNLDKQSSSCEQKKTRGSVGRRGRGRKQVAEKKEPPTTCETSPYFDKEKRTSHPEGGPDVGSSEESDEPDFLLPLRRKSSQRLSFESDEESMEECERSGTKKSRKEKVTKGKLKKTESLKEKASELKGNKRKSLTSQCGVYGKNLTY